MKEIWKDIEGYEGLYQASNLGRIKSLIYHNGTQERILVPRTNRNGYSQVLLYKDGNHKTFLVHRLVGKTFLQKSDISFDQINHLDGNKTNNKIDNLEWTNSMLNNRHRVRVLGASGLPACIKVKCLETNKVYYSIREAEREYGRIGLSKVVRKIKGHNTYAGLHWVLID